MQLIGNKFIKTFPTTNHFFTGVHDQFKEIYPAIASSLYPTQETLQDLWKKKSFVGERGLQVYESQDPMKDLSLYASSARHALLQTKVSLRDDALEQLSVVMGSWAFTTHELFGGKLFPTYPKPLILIQQGDPISRAQVLQAMYWWFRDGGCPSNITDKGSITWEIPPMDDFFKEWAGRFSYYDLSCYSPKFVQEDLLPRVSQVAGDWFGKRGPLVFTGHLRHINEMSRHLYAGEIVI